MSATATTRLPSSRPVLRFNDIIDIFYPPLCPMCGHLIQPDEPCLCHTCMAHLPRTEQAQFRQNGTEQLFMGKTPHFRRGGAFLFFDRGAPVQYLIHTFKYGRRPEIGYHLAREAAQDWMQTDFFDDIDLIIPIPLHPHRYRKRGYNQSEWIARGLSEVTGIPIDTTHVERVKDNPHQARLHQSQRDANVCDIFQINHPEEMYHKHILLVDDLITTGATMRACLHAMRRFRGARFSVFALGKAR